MINLRLMNQLETVLSKQFNLHAFRPGQKEIITDLLKGNDVLGILPTGSGKSLCYQLPAKLLPGTTIVVSPLISLMIDQVKQLRAKGFKDVIAINSLLDFKQRKGIYANLSAYSLIYLSPEILQQDELLSYLTKIDIRLFVIDEAHCISQWGHEFRPDYLRLHSVIEMLNNPPILALSATANEDVQADIIHALKRPKMIKHIYPIDKPNIAFHVVRLQDEDEKLHTLTKLVSTYRVPTLIYFSRREDTETIAHRLATQLVDRKVAFYHGGLDAFDRLMIQQQFMNDQLDIICCTSAFGMGIDKDNVRLVIHYHFPAQLESFIQEVGRAGRDGGESISVLLYTENDEIVPQSFIQQELPTKQEIAYVFHQLSQLAKEHNQIPRSLPEIINLMQINETKWRYLYFQLESQHILANQQINYDADHWQRAFQHILEHRHARFQYKQNKLNEMLKWIHSTTCLREMLYAEFQSSFQSPVFQCCTNCGFSFANWQPVEQSTTSQPIKTWQEQLKLLMLGEQHESK